MHFVCEALEILNLNQQIPRLRIVILPASRIRT